LPFSLKKLSEVVGNFLSRSEKFSVKTED
jgi:hypothetical protein